MLAVSGLKKSYASGGQIHTVFDGLELEAAEGESVALLGTSGSGKTTLLNLLSAIDSPDSGSVHIDGIAIHRLHEPARTLFRRNNIGFVFQFFNLIPTLTVGENIALPVELLGKDRKQSRARASALLEAIGLPHMADRYPETLSGGEQQRTAVARALAHEPRLLLADEPTGNLDTQTGERVIELLTGLARDHGTTMVIVTHSTDVARAADRIMHLRDGQLAMAS